MLCDVKSPAKINVFLKVYEKNISSYHELESLMLKLNWGDTLHLGIETSKFQNIQIQVPRDPSLENKENLMFKALEIFAEATQSTFDANIYLDKHIFVGGGLGGGSSNAGVLLATLNQHFQKLPQSQLMALAADLGADLPFFVQSNPAAMVSGIGTTVEPWKNHIQAPILLVNPGVHVETAKVYALLERSRDAKKYLRPQISLRRKKSIDSMDDLLSLASLGNDMQKAAEKAHPCIRVARRDLEEQGAILAQMSGSGGTVFGLFERDDLAQKAEKSLKKKWNVIMTHTAVDSH